jgi:hypothetical protein
LRVCSCVALSLTRGRVCCLQLLLALAGAVILGSEFRGTRDHILLSQIGDFPIHRLLRLTGLRWGYWTLPPRVPLLFFMNALPRKNHVLIPKQRFGLQLSVSVSLETVFCNQLLSRNQSLSGNVFAHSFPRNGPHVTIFKNKALRNRRVFCWLLVKETRFRLVYVLSIYFICSFLKWKIIRKGRGWSVRVLVALPRTQTNHERSQPV